MDNPKTYGIQNSKTKTIIYIDVLPKQSKFSLIVEKEGKAKKYATFNKDELAIEFLDILSSFVNT